MLRPSGILECCLYATDLDAAESFYAGVLGLEPFAREAGRHVFFRAGPSSVLLVFDPARTGDPAAQSSVGGVPVPLHGASGPGHVAFSVAEPDLDAWRRWFSDAGVEIEAGIAWPRGGRSIYVRDPAGNSVELATPRIWGLDEAPAGA